MTYLNIILDLAMIGLLVVGILYAQKLTRQLAGMRASHAEMERFVFEFNATVTRAEAGVRNLKNTARSAGDDLEKLIEKGQALRDELHFLTESADQIANRLSSNATKANAARPTEPQTQAAATPQRVAEIKEMPRKPATANPQALAQEIKSTLSASGKAPSTAERELLRALEKLG